MGAAQPPGERAGALGACSCPAARQGREHPRTHPQLPVWPLPAILPSGLPAWLPIQRHHRLGSPAHVRHAALQGPRRRLLCRRGRHRAGPPAGQQGGGEEARRPPGDCHPAPRLRVRLAGRARHGVNQGGSRCCSGRLPSYVGELACRKPRDAPGLALPVTLASMRPCTHNPRDCCAGTLPVLVPLPSAQSARCFFIPPHPRFSPRGNVLSSQACMRLSRTSATSPRSAAAGHANAAGTPPTDPQCSIDCWILPWVFWFWAQFVLPASGWLLGQCGPAALVLVLPMSAAVWVPPCRRHFVR